MRYMVLVVLWTRLDFTKSAELLNASVGRMFRAVHGTGEHRYREPAVGRGSVYGLLTFR